MDIKSTSKMMVDIKSTSRKMMLEAKLANGEIMMEAKLANMRVTTKLKFQLQKSHLFQSRMDWVPMDKNCIPNGVI